MVRDDKNQAKFDFGLSPFLFWNYGPFDLPNILISQVSVQWIEAPVMKSFGIYMVMGHKSHAKLDLAHLVLYMLLEFQCDSRNLWTVMRAGGLAP